MLVHYLVNSCRILLAVFLEYQRYAIEKISQAHGFRWIDLISGIDSIQSTGVFSGMKLFPDTKTDAYIAAPVLIEVRAQENGGKYTDKLRGLLLVLSYQRNNGVRENLFSVISIQNIFPT